MLGGGVSLMVLESTLLPGCVHNQPQHVNFIGALLGPSALGLTGTLAVSDVN